jgi:hypothetical protein
MSIATLAYTDGLGVITTARSPSWRVLQDFERVTMEKQKMRAGVGKKEAEREDGRAGKEEMPSLGGEYSVALKV